MHLPIWHSFELLGLSIPKKECHPFEWLELHISFHRKCHLFERLVLSIRTAWAIRLEKIVICSNTLGYPFEKNCYPFKQIWLSVWKRNCRPFMPLKLSVQDKFQPSFHPKTILSLFRVERSVILEWSRYEGCLQIHHEYCHGSLLLCSHLRFHTIL